MHIGALAAVLASIYKPGNMLLDNTELFLLWLGIFLSNLINPKLMLKSHCHFTYTGIES